MRRTSSRRRALVRVGVDGRGHDGVMIATGTAVTGGRHQRRAGSKSQRRGTGRHGDALREELDLHPVALEVAITEQTHDSALAQRREKHRSRVRVERLDTNADGLALLLEPGKELGWIEFLGDGGHGEPDRVEKGAAPLPRSNVGQRDNDAPSALLGGLQMLETLGDFEAISDRRSS